MPVIAALAMPSLAVAHEGHAHHHAPAVEKAAVRATLPTQVNKGTAAADEAIVSIASLTVAPTAAARDARAADDCASHCCGGSAGMTCCGAALAPDLICVELFRTSVPFVMPHDLPPSGLPPEALPKPPKSSA
jgi:hypothetical protein